MTDNQSHLLKKTNYNEQEESFAPRYGHLPACLRRLRSQNFR